MEYFDLLSPEPVYLKGIGSILCPTLREISRISYPVYQMYLSLLLLTPKVCYDMIGQPECYAAMSEETQAKLHSFDLIIQNTQLRELTEKMLNFFMAEKAVFNDSFQCFLLYQTSESETPSGAVGRDAWPVLCELLLQRNCIKLPNEDLTKVKNKRAQTIAKKLQKGRTQMKRSRKDNQDLELGNIISAVAAQSSSLNLSNIWELTVYQLWDAFYRICNNNIYDIQAMSVAAYGNRDHSFDPCLWYKNLTTNNK